MIEPIQKRAILYFDGQNLFNQAKEAFGYHFPNYDPLLLARSVCQSSGWQFVEARFYTGLPDSAVDPSRHAFWVNKIAQMGRVGVQVVTRKLRYRNKTFQLADGTAQTLLTGEEKGIDVRIALDVISGARRGLYDVAVLFSQDQDLAEVATEIRMMAREQDRWIKIASAFPDSPAARNRRGINGADWIRIDRATYDQCIDPRDYRRMPNPS